MISPFEAWRLNRNLPVVPFLTTNLAAMGSSWADEDAFV
jgi:hypothetical protein